MSDAIGMPDALTPFDKTVQCSRVCTIEIPANSVAVLTFRSAH